MLKQVQQDVVWILAGRIVGYSEWDVWFSHHPVSSVILSLPSSCLSRHPEFISGSLRADVDADIDADIDAETSSAGRIWVIQHDGGMEFSRT